MRALKFAISGYHYNGNSRMYTCCMNVSYIIGHERAYFEWYLEIPTHNVYDIVNTVILLYQTLLRSLHVSVHRTIIR
jgi:hypothetical protein